MEITGKTKEECKKIKQDKHSAWLTFMYPRLYLAKKLLKDTGVIFVSIDDNEQANLKLLMDEIFGEGSFLATLKWKKKKQSSFLSRVAGIIEYINIYAKNIKNIDKLSIEKVSDRDKPVVNASNQISERTLPAGTRVKFNGTEIKAGIYKNKTMSTEYLNDVVIKNNRTINEVKIKAKFRTGQKEIEEFIKQDLLFITKNCGLSRDLTKEEKNSNKSITDLLLDWGQNQDATDETKNLFGLTNDENIFSNPKPTKLIINLIKSHTKIDNIILDFFAGSATTADAVMQLNAEDGGNRKYIMVQIPENLDEKSVAYKSGYKTIDEISRERIKRVANKIKEENPEYAKNADLGFKHFHVKE